MEIVVLSIEVFGMSALLVAFAKYSIAKRKMAPLNDNKKNGKLLKNS